MSSGYNTKAGDKHFKDFYDKLNVLSEINKIDKKVKQTLRQSITNILAEKKIDEITNEQHSSEELIKTFTYSTQKDENNIRATVLQVGSVEKPITIKISNDVTINDKQEEPIPKDESMWFNLFRDRSTKEPNIIDFNSKNTGREQPHKATDIHPYHYITNLFKFDTTNTAWHSKFDMLALFNRPFLLLTFEMKYYNHYGLNLFNTNFDVIPKSREWNLDAHYITLESLIYIEQFSGALRPNFLMLLIYYAGYNFKITKDDIIGKFRNKFSQSSNGMSFEIKSYIQEADSLETKYNNKIISTIKPTCVNLDVEELLVYHVGGKIESLWDYVNGKLTILINNMLNSKDKERYKTLFKKQYTSNSLFLFECISELKKYKEYISNPNPENLKDIAYPMSTLKTLEILILKLSYILSVLEPTFIPIETMSFDVNIDGKKLKYVINSELQATNIGIDDYISNNKLMAAFISIKDCLIYNDNRSKDILAAMFSYHEDKNIYIKFLQKEADNYRDMKIRTSIDIKRLIQKSDTTLQNTIEEERSKLKKINSQLEKAIALIKAFNTGTFEPELLAEFNDKSVSEPTSPSQDVGLKGNAQTTERHEHHERREHHEHHGDHRNRRNREHSRRIRDDRGAAPVSDARQNTSILIKNKTQRVKKHVSLNLPEQTLPVQQRVTPQSNVDTRQYTSPDGYGTDYNQY